MSRETPDHHDADLVLRVYDMRREAVMRQSRDALAQRFWPKKYEDLKEVASQEHPLNAAWRQVAAYWELVYGMVRHGIVHPAYFLESNGEGLFLFAKIDPYLEQYRKEFSPTAFQNTAWVARESPDGKRLYETIAARVKRMAASR